jgi:hypothetical protein
MGTVLHVFCAQRRRQVVCAVVVASAALAWGGAAAAHGLGMSQLRLRVGGARIDGEWELQLHDARLALGLDPQMTGEPGWREVIDRAPALRAYMAARLSITSAGAPCPVVLPPSAPTLGPAGLDAGVGAPILLPVAAACPVEPARLDLRCEILFDADAKHRAYFSVEDARVTHVGLFRADRRTATLELYRFRAGEIIAEFVRDGIGHIWSGLDHVFFLLALLLPAPLLRTRDRQWLPRPGLRPTAREVVKVVTAFTVAHSVTLALSFFGVLAPPALWVEVAIALSVVAAAWNNLRPFLPGRAWLMALAFGLIHGLGFAGALGNLSLPPRARGLALAAFNVGVEVGQLAIVAALLPLLHAGARRRWYPRLVMGVGSWLIAWVAAVWTVQRAFALHVLPDF